LTTISNAMSRQVATISSNQTVQEAAELMSRHNIGAIPVVDQGVLKGMITDRDITLRTTAEGQDGQTPVSNVMTTNVVSGNPNMSLEEASQLMAQSQIRRLPIVDNNHLVCRTGAYEHFDSGTDSVRTEELASYSRLFFIYTYRFLVSSLFKGRQEGYNEWCKQSKGVGLKRDD